jgi:hypothetical protein
MSEVSAWRQAGRLSLWHYTENERNYPGWHLSLDSAGSISLATLLRAFAESKAESYRTLVVTAPTRAVLGVANNRGGAAGFRAPSKWRLKYLPDPDSSKTWRFGEEGSVVELTVGSDGLEELITGVEGIPQGKGDYSIGLDANEELWFWWWPTGHVA